MAWPEDEAVQRWWQDGFTAGADPEYEEQILPLAAQHLAGARRILDIGTGEGQLARLAASTSVMQWVAYRVPALREQSRRGGSSPAPKPSPPLLPPLSFAERQARLKAPALQPRAGRCRVHGEDLIARHQRLHCAEVLGDVKPTADDTHRDRNAS